MKRRPQERGSAILQTLITGAVILVLGVYAMTAMHAPHQGARNSLSIQGVQLVRQSILNNLSHDYAWAQTIASNPSMTCLKQPGAVCSPDGSLIEIHSADPTESPVVKQAANSGFGWDGTPCDQFDSVNGNDLCPLRFEVTWSCASGSCEPTSSESPVPLFPKIAISAKLVLSPATRTNVPPLSTAYFSVNQFYRTVSKGTDTATMNGVSRNLSGEASVTDSTACSSILGYFDSDSHTCEAIRPTSAQNFCDPSSQAFRGVDSSGETDCEPRPPIVGRCPHRTGVTGINPDGSLRCDGF